MCPWCMDKQKYRRVSENRWPVGMTICFSHIAYLAGWTFNCAPATLVASAAREGSFNQFIANDTAAADIIEIELLYPAPLML